MFNIDETLEPSLGGVSSIYTSVQVRFTLSTMMFYNMFAYVKFIKYLHDERKDCEEFFLLGRPSSRSDYITFFVKLVYIFDFGSGNKSPGDKSPKRLIFNTFHTLFLSKNKLKQLKLHKNKATVRRIE